MGNIRSDPFGDDLSSDVVNTVKRGDDKKGGLPASHVWLPNATL